MKICSACHAAVDDNATVCPQCGAVFVNQQNPQNPQQYYAAPAPVADPTDHTAEFAPQDIQGYKLFAILPYVFSVVGIIISLLAAKDSRFVAFHIRQALKIDILNVILGACSALLCWTLIVPVAAVVCFIILFVVRIICFFSVCSGKAKEPPIVSSFAFLK